MGEEAFRFSLNLPLNVLPDSLMFSSLQSTLAHFHPYTLESIYHSPFLEDVIFVLWVDQEVSDGLVSFKVLLYVIFAADSVTVFTQPFGARYHYVNILLGVLWWAVCSVIGTVCGHVWFLAFDDGSVRAQLGYLQSCSACLI